MKKCPTCGQILEKEIRKQILEELKEKVKTYGIYKLSKISGLHKGNLYRLIKTPKQVTIKRMIKYNKELNKAIKSSVRQQQEEK